MSIEIGSKWIRDWEVVEVKNILKAPSAYLWWDVVWFMCQNKKLHIILKEDFLEQYKPYEPVHEWQWAYITNSLLRWHISNYMTEEEFKTWQGSSNSSLEYQRLDFTKRERK